jgi:hypothetical protein
MKKPKEFFGTEFEMSGTAHLSIKNGPDGPVRFSFVGLDGCAPTSGYVFGDREILENAWQAGHATLAMLNKTFRVKVIAKNETIGAVEIASDSVFRALVELATSEC